MRRLTQQEVKTNLKNMGLESLSLYVNNKTSLKLKHIECGHVFNRTLNHLEKNPNCPRCFPPKNARMSIEKVREIVENKQDHRLLSTKYINKKTPIEIECLISGQKVTTTFDSYNQSKGCKACYLLKRKEIEKKKKEQKLEEFRKAMLKEGYIFRTKDYQSNKQLLEYTCPRGHQGKIHWNNLKNWLARRSRCRKCKYEGMSGEGSAFWKGGFFSRELASYETFAHRIEIYEKIRPDPKEPGVLQALCNSCSKWYRPKRSAIKSRIEAIDADGHSENRLYCSEKCKKQCEIYRKSPFQCDVCRGWFLGRAYQKYCDNCSPKRRTFSQSAKDSIYHRDIKLGRIDAECKYAIHHILPTSAFPEYATENWNGITVDLDRHSMIHNACLVARTNFEDVDPSYFEFAISTLKENNAPKEIVAFCIRLYGNR